MWQSVYNGGVSVLVTDEFMDCLITEKFMQSLVKAGRNVNDSASNLLKHIMKNSKKENITNEKYIQRMRFVLVMNGVPDFRVVHSFRYKNDI